MPHNSPLLLLCGLLCDATIWRHQVAGLATEAQIQVHDFRGHDRIEAMAAAVLRDAPARFALAGHSMGARVALEVVRQAPQRIMRIALLDTGIHTVRLGEREQRMRLLEVARSQGMRALAGHWLPPMLRAGGEADAAQMDELRAMVERMSPEDFHGQIEALLHRPDPRPLLPDLPQPVLLGVGEQDRWSPPAQHEEIAVHLPGTRPVVFAGAGHMAPYEAPEAVNLALRQWLRTAPGTA